MTSDQRHHSASEFDEKAATWDDDPTRVARAADVAKQILTKVRPARDARVLDFGSGTGLLGFQFLPHVASVTFADTSEGMLRQVEAKLADGPYRNGEVFLLDSETLSLPRRYDLIVSLMTLHHVPDPTAALGLLADHLEPEGWLAVCDLDTEDGSFHDDPDMDVHHGFDRPTLTSILEDLGLQEVEATTAYVMHRVGPEGSRPYPLFLLTGRKPA